MQFEVPTNKQEMYSTLQDIFYYYRIRRVGFEGIVLQELSLERLNYTPMTAAEISHKAEMLVMPAHKKRVEDYKRELSEKIYETENEILLAAESAEKLKSETLALFSVSEEKARAEAVKKGLANSSVALSEIAALESRKNSKISEISLAAEEKIQKLQAQKAALEEKFSAAEERFNDVFLAEKAQKTIEINDEEQALIRDLFKYNNGLDEKEQRYANVIKQTNANLEIKYLQVESNYFGKDQLIEMGYYEDAIDCVCAYYDLLPPADAFGDIKTESKLMIYLDEYYQTLVYMYKTRAGL